ncbi:Regulator of ribonuclease activity B [Andreprevotia lacus DSM 23236]|jgi:hypothetical protein|uniref:Regulator of ribonuclease activity B n=1 Tax=Andreprevotia lacus DSM 23236 TaxID=1121001 RepID=A0A1W1XXQ3_9NEIS|nr:DUF695 domain-containing protein [Andreprevotia lacus]SMC28713.1 Regulator of ribonuclease activity B [Andreprevotia lacus DSM 23236]
MAANWDFYSLLVNDKPASIFVDLDAIATAPDAALPFMAFVSLKLRHPQADGLCGPEEYEALNKLEDALIPALTQDDSAFVGRCTTAGRRDFIFYLASAEEWCADVAVAMQSFPEYNYQQGMRHEPEWPTYLEFLYPGPADRLMIEDRRVCRALEQHGDALQAAREVDHWTSFTDTKQRDAFVAAVAEQGFQLRQTTSQQDAALPYQVQISRVDTPSYASISSITLPLSELAARYGGRYQGWGCPVVA